MRLLLICLLAATCLTALADTARAAAPTGHIAQRYQRVLDRAHVPIPPGMLVVDDTNGCPTIPGAGGCVGAAPCVECIYLLPGADRFAFAHELGHLFDRRKMDDGARNRFLTLLHKRHRPWRCARAVCHLGTATPAERFADAYAACLLGMEVRGRVTRSGAVAGGWTTAYGYLPSAREHRAVCALIRKVGRR